ncbi:MAG: tRNA (adenosine(37)-N6)-threonylcarbamoyltransferase complex ATPase subunit type 1 TsaE [Acidobacteria bacterium]|nr:tRNA (adenosine(37)-N6)-threonylcarbamoyltransferase complex ATPase subunit type 1 TsaE [Acidobacteriota bacterium]
MTRITITRSEDETIAIGRHLGAALPAGATVLLRGELGAGKTAFVRGLAEGMGVATDEVSSPTFTLVQQYRGAVPLFHADLYRISSMEADDLGLEELNEQGVVAIEWAEKLSRMPDGAIDVQIDDLGGDLRRMTIVTPD